MNINIYLKIINDTVYEIHVSKFVFTLEIIITKSSIQIPLVRARWRCTFILIKIQHDFYYIYRMMNKECASAVYLIFHFYSFMKVL